MNLQQATEGIATETRCKNWWNGYHIPFKFCVLKSENCKCERAAKRILETLNQETPNAQVKATQTSFEGNETPLHPRNAPAGRDDVLPKIPNIVFECYSGNRSSKGEAFTLLQALLRLSTNGNNRR